MICALIHELKKLRNKVNEEKFDFVVILNKFKQAKIYYEIPRRRIYTGK